MLWGESYAATATDLRWNYRSCFLKLWKTPRQIAYSSASMMPFPYCSATTWKRRSTLCERQCKTVGNCNLHQMVSHTLHTSITTTMVANIHHQTCGQVLHHNERQIKRQIIWWIVEHDEISIEYQIFMVLHILNIILNKRMGLMKRENMMVHTYLSLLLRKLLWRGICWEFVVMLIRWFS